jgi:hypothetical protein
VWVWSWRLVARVRSRLRGEQEIRFFIRFLLGSAVLAFSGTSVANLDGHSADVPASKALADRGDRLRVEALVDSTVTGSIPGDAGRLNLAARADLDRSRIARSNESSSGQIVRVFAMLIGHGDSLPQRGFARGSEGGEKVASAARAELALLPKRNPRRDAAGTAPAAIAYANVESLRPRRSPSHPHMHGSTIRFRRARAPRRSRSASPRRSISRRAASRSAVSRRSRRSSSTG